MVYSLLEFLNPVLNLKKTFKVSFPLSDYLGLEHHWTIRIKTLKLYQDRFSGEGQPSPLWRQCETCLKRFSDSTAQNEQVLLGLVSLTPKTKAGVVKVWGFHWMLWRDHRLTGPVLCAADWSVMLFYGSEIQTVDSHRLSVWDLRQNQLLTCIKYFFINITLKLSSQ